MKYCEKCGSLMADDDPSCGNCGAAARGGEGPRAAPRPESAGYPPKYLVQSILVLLFCCVPGGVIALIYGDKVDKLMAEGRTEEAWQASKTAKYWLIGSAAVCGAITLIICLISVIMVFVAAAAA